MKIGVLGAGSMAHALGGQWVAQGHEVFIGGRDGCKAEALGAELGAQSGSLREAAEFGDVVLMGVHWAGIEDTAVAIGDAVRGKVVIDCGNPVEVEGFTLITEPGDSLGELIQRRTGARVVKAFNLCHAEVWQMRPPVFDGRPLAVPYSSDDPAAKEVVAQLIREMGADPIDLGPLYHSKDLEGMGTVIITLLFGGLAPRTVFNLVAA
ncbi:NADPH-dependent F420 reductase [Dactylosporangium cerinum]|uniref:NADPH-dependent F420 reductase n=1 Tax=Dactylosporangium cerinum TaxID=1434730 RepID=A0ABV9W2A2_9ACTN